MVSTWYFPGKLQDLLYERSTACCICDDGHIADIVKEFSIGWFHKTLHIPYTKLMFLDQFLEN